MTRIAGQRRLLLLSCRRHVDLLRVSSAICRPCC
ncbi:MAG: putative leader peptide [Streptosporangiaceae bacterium]